MCFVLSAVLYTIFTFPSDCQTGRMQTVIKLPLDMQCLDSKSGLNINIVIRTNSLITPGTLYAKVTPNSCLVQCLLSKSSMTLLRLHLKLSHTLETIFVCCLGALSRINSGICIVVEIVFLEKDLHLPTETADFINLTEGKLLFLCTIYMQET